MLPPVLRDERNLKFNSSVDGKALLHDLDQKFESQDRLMTFLISQFNNLEQTVQGLNRKTQGIQDLERDARSKLENSIKFSNDQSHYSLQEVSQKILSLEDQIRREEKMRVELRDKLKNSEEANREMVNFIKSIQNQGDQELTQMRQFL